MNPADHADFGLLSPASAGTAASRLTSDYQFIQAMLDVELEWTRVLADADRMAAEAVPAVERASRADLYDAAGLAERAQGGGNPVIPLLADLRAEMPGMLYCRSYGGNQMLVSEGIVGEALQNSDAEQGDIPLDYVAEVGEQVATRFPAYETAGLASSWTGVYDVTPDWNPVLGRVPGVQGLIVGFGFSGHGFKLSPTVGRVLAQEALGLATDVSLKPYDIGRFASGALLTGKYGLGAVS